MEQPKAGEIWKHFKGKEYKIICIATETETGVPMVVYTSLDQPYIKIWCRMQSKFCEILDKQYYPEAEQVHRFEKVN